MYHIEIEESNFFNKLGLIWEQKIRRSHADSHNSVFDFKWSGGKDGTMQCITISILHALVYWRKDIMLGLEQRLKDPEGIVKYSLLKLIKKNNREMRATLGPCGVVGLSIPTRSSCGFQ